MTKKHKSFDWKSNVVDFWKHHVPTKLKSKRLFTFFLIKFAWLKLSKNQFKKKSFAEARAEISGPSEKYLKPGSILRLTCRVVESIENPLYIFWYQNNQMINYDSHRGVNVSTDSGLLFYQFEKMLFFVICKLFCR